jgi:hypothetical protein
MGVDDCMKEFSGNTWHGVLWSGTFYFFPSQHSGNINLKQLFQKEKEKSQKVV